MNTNCLPVLFLACTLCASCAPGQIVQQVIVHNDSGVSASEYEINSMATLICPTCDPVDVWLIPFTQPQRMRLHGYGEYEAFDDEKHIRVIYPGRCWHKALAHELLHWKLHCLTGDSDHDHAALDWALVDVVLEMYPCDPEETPL
jgi:hypothetical protein